ncbi:TPA_asm: terminase small subunit TerS [Methanobrevibacter gottschalkii virus vir075]|uniref:Uncharacterized protein n=1 Tax=Methanobrevibacter gottschalkii TaxID=190974 RepID=A0A1H7I7M8_9EURY|nr:hypothetical protein [Methanobrevibacter gottschalkii]SEK58551.1 hypothetical protein SAMN05216439_1167 [Methanobrevibacter gottschalkii]
MSEIWEERQTDEKGKETARAFEVFTQYLYSPKPRRIEKFFKWQEKEAIKKNQKPSKFYSIKSWSIRWHWKERADAFDMKNVERIRNQNKVLVDDAFGNQVRTILEQIDDLDQERKSIKYSPIDDDKKILSLKRNSENKAILMKELRLIMGMSTDNNKSVVEHNGLKRLADAFK